MKYKSTIRIFLSLLVFVLFSTSTFANKTSVKITAPKKAKAGSEVTIKIEVSHKGNSTRHYTNEVIVKVNGKEFKQWEYTKSDLPKGQKFTLEFKIKVESELEIEVEGNCNKHGSKGSEKAIIKVE